MLYAISSVLRHIEIRVRKAAYSPRRWVNRQTSRRDVTELGACRYGSWSVCTNEIPRNSVVLLCGAGEDVSFDLALQKQFDCRVIVVDPTPRAIEHFANLKAAQQTGKKVRINNSSTRFYDTSGVDLSRIDYVPLAVWHEKAKVKFWAPFFRGHVSHSITNYQCTSQYMEVEADTIDSVLRRVNVDRSEVTLVKLDIEGAEYSVIHWMYSNGFFPRQLLIEFDEMNFPNRRTSARVRKSICRLLEHGYKLVYFDGVANCSFLRE